MPVTIVVGGQFGSEGKGKVAHYLAKTMNADVAVRVGGSNSGHTVIDEFGMPRIFRHLPTASILNDVICILATGSYINLKVLYDEIKSTNLTPDRLIIDPQTMIISEDDIKNERKCGLTENIGSTASGTGKAVIRRVNRIKTTILAKDIDELKPYVKPAISFMRQILNNGKRIIIEGTQGYGLSLLHSTYYPYTTSRDTTAAGFLSETGLSPLDVDEVVLVIRTFPIRVAGNSGPLEREIDWDQITMISNSIAPIIEYTSVTKKIRRVAHFHPSIQSLLIILQALY